MAALNTTPDLFATAAPLDVGALLEPYRDAIRDRADFGQCLECCADIPYSLALKGQALCIPCDNEAAAEEADTNPRFVELARRLNATADLERRA